MKNKKIIEKITQGMYALTTNGGGCIVDSVSQISSGDNILIAVSVMKGNYTNELMKKNGKFALSVLGINVDPRIIDVFGFNSSRDMNKFEHVLTNKVEGIEILKKSVGYMVCEKVDSIDNDTHTLFIGKIIEADMFRDEDVMTYDYYKKHKEELLELITKSENTTWVCMECGYSYYADELPEDYICPVCGAKKDKFKELVRVK